MSQTIGLDLLAKILADKRINDFIRLRREWFYQEEELRTYAFVSDHYREYGELPSLSVARKEVGLEPAHDDPYGYYHDRFTSRVVYNELSELLPRVQKAAASDKKPMQAVSLLEDFVNRTKSLQAESSQSLRTMKELSELAFADVLKNRYRPGMTGIPSTWPSLNHVTHGWQPGDVNLILARPKRGKSAVLGCEVNTAHQAGYIPLFISMEMTGKQIARRYLALKAKVRMDDVKSGEVDYWTEQKMRVAIKLMSEDHPLYFVEGQFKKDIAEIDALIYGLKPNIVFIDGGYLIKVARMMNAKSWERMSAVAEDLKSIAIKNNVPVVVTFQFNREVRRTDTTAGLENIQLADAVGQIASVGIGIFELEERKDRRLIEVIGGREGESGSFQINWNWTTMDFSEVVEEEVMYQ